MQYEAKGDFHKALVLYNKLLADDPKDTVSLSFFTVFFVAFWFKKMDSVFSFKKATMKRKISVFVETRQPKKAISLLNEYLQVFMADTDAWAELANLYLDQHL